MLALAGPRVRPILSYTVGWAVLLGEIATGASVATNSADLISQFVVLLHPDINWQVDSPPIAGRQASWTNSLIEKDRPG